MAKNTAAKTILLCGASALLAFGAGIAHAQDATAAPEAAQAPEQGLGEIVVTAQKREQNLQKVGIAITAVTAESIHNRNITSSADLAGRVVGLESFSPYGPGTSSNVVIRGIGVNDFGEGHEAPVTTYVDEFYIVSVPAVDFALFDLDRVEVLRGPQGTLFGRNSTGGLIHYVTAKPKDHLEGFGSATYSSFNTLKLETGISAPLAEGLSMRISGLSLTSDGFQKQLNPNLGRGGQADTQAVRLQLRYQSPDGWDLNLKGEYGRINTVHAYYETITGGVDPATGLVYADNSITDVVGFAERNSPAAAKNVAWANRPAKLQSSAKSLLFRAEKEFGSTTFTSVTGYQSYQRKMDEDSDGTPNDIVYASFPYQNREITQELRLFHKGSTTNWTAGVYGLHSIGKNQPTAVFNFPLDGPASNGDLYSGTYFPLALNADWRLRTNSISAFGQIEHDLSDKLTVLFGARVTYDNKTFRDADNAAFRTCASGQISSCFLVSQGGDGTANPFALKYDKWLASGKFEVDYKPNSDVFLYASASRGTKGGGFNNGFYPDNTQLSQIHYGDETLYAYEVGEKITLFDRKLRINSSLFYYDYKNYQVFNYFGLVGLISNQNARAYGFETEIQARITPELTAYASGAYLNTKIYDVSKAAPDGSLVVADRPMAFAPKWSGSGGLTYTVPVGESELVIDWNFEARARRYSSNFGDPGTALDAYFKHSASVMLKNVKGWDLRAFVDNISNRKNITYTGPSFASLGIIQVRYAMPRTAGAAVSYHF